MYISLWWCYCLVFVLCLCSSCRYRCGGVIVLFLCYICVAHVDIAVVVLLSCFCVHMSVWWCCLVSVYVSMPFD
jgi:hypothetical protein